MISRGEQMNADPSHTGGCQCGAVRYRADPPRDRAGICFCRMCQKASGQPFMAFVRFRETQVHWSTPPQIFKSSNMVERGFCAACGTPLTYRRIGGPYISLTLMSLDIPSACGRKWPSQARRHRIGVTPSPTFRPARWT